MNGNIQMYCLKRREHGRVIAGIRSFNHLVIPRIRVSNKLSLSVDATTHLSASGLASKPNPSRGLQESIIQRVVGCRLTKRIYHKGDPC